MRTSEMQVLFLKYCETLEKTSLMQYIQVCRQAVVMRAGAGLVICRADTFFCKIF